MLGKREVLECIQYSCLNKYVFRISQIYEGKNMNIRYTSKEKYILNIYVTLLAYIKLFTYTYFYYTYTSIFIANDGKIRILKTMFLG